MSIKVDTGETESICSIEAEFEILYNKPSRSKYVYDRKLKGKHRKFDYNLHATFDIPARNKLIEVLGDYVSEHPDEVQQDFIINSETCKYKYLEVQVISRWVGDDYPYPTLYIYERKAKYKSDTLFLTFNRHLTKGFIFDRDSINNIEPRRFKKYSREFVYDIPWNRIMPFYTKNLDKETIELY
jgi:hypothetical protein